MVMKDVNTGEEEMNGMLELYYFSKFFSLIFLNYFFYF